MAILRTDPRLPSLQITLRLAEVFAHVKFEASLLRIASRPPG